MKKYLRIVSLIMLIAAIIFVISAFLSMGSTVTLPFTVEQLHIFYKAYLITMMLLFIISFFMTDKKS